MPMMRRTFPRTAAPRTQLCQICELIYGRHVQTAKRTIVTLNAGRPVAKLPQQIQQIASSRPITAKQAIRSITTSRPKHARPTQSYVQSNRQRQEVTDLTSLAAAVDRVTKAFLAQPGIPSEEITLAALRACAQNDARQFAESEPRPEPSSNREGTSDTIASQLLHLDKGKLQTAGRGAARIPESPVKLNVQDVMDKISEAAYAIITHPTVTITPQLLEEYVQIQARLGKPETLPEILDAFRLKPIPREVAGSLRLTPRNPDQVNNAVSANVAEMALDTAIEAKNLDAAIGVIENTYATKAFVRSKLVKVALLPASLFAVAPVAAYVVASNLSLLQDSMDKGTATSVAFAGILAYLGFTATLGVVMVTTANDQMNRVTWAPGLPLRQRWLREEERAALDKVACSFGFSEPHRWGEEEGTEFQALRQYILGRDMVLDAVELMEGIN